jgi:hypothetical protein
VDFRFLERSMGEGANRLDMGARRKLGDDPTETGVEVDL